MVNRSAQLNSTTTVSQSVSHGFYPLDLVWFGSASVQFALVVGAVNVGSEAKESTHWEKLGLFDEKNQSTLPRRRIPQIQRSSSPLSQTWDSRGGGCSAGGRGGGECSGGKCAVGAVGAIGAVGAVGGGSSIERKFNGVEEEGEAMGGILGDGSEKKSLALVIAEGESLDNLV